ncbi:MAG: hypothetical protein IPI01_16705 [Ignavibacteriae bacterium]|nr:hypothetical protein [Ignavibacteriota bacterium]
MKFGSAWVFTAGGEKVDSRYIRAITAGDTHLFAGGEGGMLFYSGNAGVHWTRISQMWLDSAIISMAAIGPVAFVGTYGKGVYMSSDAGATWTPMNTGLANKSVQALLAYDTLLLAGTDDGVFRSSYAGQNWTPTGGAIAGKVVRSLLRSSGGLFAGTENGEVYRSTDLGGVGPCEFGPSWGIGSRPCHDG